jgi:ribosomal protein S18 acetylase RimI-like enzyme
MTNLAFLRRVRIEPFDRNQHDRAAFSCGETRIDNFLQKSGSKRQDQNFSRVFVACLDTLNTVTGFYSLNAHAIDVSSLPEDVKKKLPQYPTVPAVYLSMIGVDAKHQGNGLGSFLLADAFKKTASAAENIGIHFLVLDALNERAASLYRRLGFVDLPGQEARMLMAMTAVQKWMKQPASTQK